MSHPREMKRLLVASAAAVGIVAGAAILARPAAGAPAPRIAFVDAHRQAMEFIAAERTITLTREQAAVMKEGLSKISAPCCADYSMATCCCPCNLARSTWGLSKILITRNHASPREVRQKVKEWLAFVNSDGFTGDACFTGGCGRSFRQNGCGGMDSKRLI